MTDRLAAHQAIVTTSLSKQYKQITALSDLSLQVEAGTVFGFLGPNGAGKTTTIRLLLGFITPTSGSAMIFGLDTRKQGVEARRHIGFLVPADGFYPEMTGRSQLDLAARLSGKQPVLRERLLDVLELSRNDLDRKQGQYSKGMKQKLALVAAVQHDPMLLILDEPTDGLDPLIQRRFELFLREFNARGRTVFMSSHDLAEVERTCETVAIVKQGRLVARDTIEDIRRRRLRQADVTFRECIPPALESIEGVRVVSVTGSRAVLAIEGEVNPLIQFLAGHDVSEVTIVPPSLEEVFMAFYEPLEPAFASVAGDGAGAGGAF